MVCILSHTPPHTDTVLSATFFVQIIRRTSTKYWARMPPHSTWSARSVRGGSVVVSEGSFDCYTLRACMSCSTAHTPATEDNQSCTPRLVPQTGLTHSDWRHARTPALTHARTIANTQARTNVPDPTSIARCISHNCRYALRRSNADAAAVAAIFKWRFVLRTGSYVRLIRVINTA